MKLLVTGHTGFKGGWLALYAHALGHDVYGYGLGRTTGPSLYREAKVRRVLAGETRGDVTDGLALRRAIAECRPDAVLHLAARAIVKESFSNPVGTIHANVMGTAHVLEAVRQEGAPATVIVTTDKVYRNDGRTGAYSEKDHIGGLDPYGASKAACECIAASYRATYGVRLATARSGNVIGGGDWGAHRLVPACMEAFSEGRAPTVYDAERPFLHVLDSIRGYLMLAESLVESPRFSDAYNFGPDGSYPLTEVADQIAEAMGGRYTRAGKPPKEAQYLSLATSKARRALGWSPCWDVKEAVGRTVAWYQAWREGSDMELVSREQVQAHIGAVARLEKAA